MKKVAAPGKGHRGKTYHEFMLGSPRDQRVRERFREFALHLVPAHGTILDFGAGTGIDAKHYAARGYRVFVHEPCEVNLCYLREHCREEITNGMITITDLSPHIGVQLITANFAVLNLVPDHRQLFKNFAQLVSAEGFVLASLLNPFFMGDARYPWWRKNLLPLLHTGSYAVEGEGGPIRRFLPSAVVRAAEPGFRLTACLPRGVKCAASRYVFMLFKRR